MLEARVVKKLPLYTLDIEFSMGDEILAVLGSSGAGKTTLLQCLAGLIKPEQGYIRLNNTVLFDSRIMACLPPQQRRVGYLFQDYVLFPHLNVWQNITYGCSRKNPAYIDKGQEMLETFGVAHLRSRYPGEISGGEKQRVALVRALMFEPQLLLLDEPLSALDQITRFKLQKELRKTHEIFKIPFILVTHNLKEASLLSDRVIHVNEGKQLVKRHTTQYTNNIQ